MKVAGLGQCSLDYLIVVDDYPREDTKKEIIDWTVQGGGPVATALVALSRLGVGTTFMGLVSDDEAGKIIERRLANEKVDVKDILVRKGGRSQTAFITINREGGTRTILWQRPTVKVIRPSEVKRSLLKGAGLLLLDGLFAEASIKAAEMAKAMEIPVMIDAGRMREGMEELLRHSDYIVASEEFGREFSDTTERTLRKLMKFQPEAATITLGERGSMTIFRGGIFHQPAFDVDVVDTTGAGDVFHGGYIYGLLKEWEIEKTVRFASAFAGLKCRKLGGRSGIPTLQETMQFMEE
ncbi:MAG: carbohydrate kinase family protein [Thermodesulfobacteriota bacterium]